MPAPRIHVVAHLLYKDSYHIQNAEFVYLSEDNRDLIKQKIMEYGSGTISYYSGTDVENKRYSNTGDDNYTAYYCNDASNISLLRIERNCLYLSIMLCLKYVGNRFKTINIAQWQPRIILQAALIKVLHIMAEVGLI
mgnify:CR=1 FL=1